MSTTKYPNRDALRNANDIYLDTMRPFIIRQLKQVRGGKIEDLISRILKPKQRDEFQRVLNETDDIESAIDFSYFPHIIEKHWSAAFVQRFDEDLKFQSMLWLIREGRNSCEHRGTKDLNSEFVRVNLFLISEVLAKINTDKQREVEAIRDELFFDDSAERLEKAEKDIAEYKKSLAEAKEHLADAEAKKKEYEQKNTELSEQVDVKEKQRKKLDRQLKDEKKRTAKLRSDLSGAKKRLEESETAQKGYKNRLETAQKKLKKTETEQATALTRFAAIQAEKEEVVARLTTMQDLFTTATLEKPEIRSMFPPLDTDASVRILDRRGTDKENYLRKLLNQKQPLIMYVQNEEKAEKLLKFVGAEKAGVMGKLNETTHEVEEKEILEKLARGELIAIVSSRTVSTLSESHCVEHFVFCHLTPDLEAFFEHCRLAFSSTKDAYLHLIYNSKEDTKGLNEWLTRKYPTDEVLRNLYKELKDLVGIDGDFFHPEDLYSKLNVEKLGIETGFDIFEELHLLERNKDGIKLLPPSGKKLDESKIYDRGEKLKHGIAEVCAFQLELSLEEIWEEILKKINVNTAQILRESSIDKINTNVSEVEKGVRPATKAGQSEITLPTVDVWPQRGMSAFNNLRHQITKASDETDILVEEFAEDLSSLDDVDRVRVRDAGGVYNSPVLVNQENYRNKYELAIQFIQEYGIDALEEGIAQLIEDRDDPDYNFTEDETNMLRAFQDAFWNSRAQSQ